MDQAVNPAGKPGKKWMLWLKLAVTAACLWFVSTRIDVSASLRAMGQASLPWLLLALGLYVTSKIISAYRLDIYFRNISLSLTRRGNLRLYWLGMFYNLFLPGSIGGDAYKLVLLARRYKRRYRQTAAAVLLDRFSGLAGLFILLSLYGFLALGLNWITVGALALSLFGSALLYVIIRNWMPEFLPGFFPTFLLGLAVQAVQAGAVYCIMAGLGLPPGEHGYMLLFLLSSVASVLPVSIGGLGLRELVFWKGSAWLGLAEESAVTLSLVFFLITVIASSAGILYVFADPLAKENAGLQEAGMDD